MNESWRHIVVFFVDTLLLYWLWKRIFRGTGKTILIFSIMVLTLLAIFSEFAIMVVFWLSFSVVLIFEGLRIFAFPVYTEATAAFETNQILRGLSPAEAAYFVELDQIDVYLVAILNLLDKGVLKLYFNRGETVLSIRAPYVLNSLQVTPDERTLRRSKAARADLKLIHPYEHVLIELISSNEEVPISQIDSGIWYSYFEKQLTKLGEVYDFPATAEYSREITTRMGSPGSSFPDGKRNISAWIAIQILRGGVDDGEKDHRPDWLPPDDDFQSLILELRDRIMVSR